MITTINPYTNEVLKHYDQHSKLEMETIIEQAAKAYSKWKNIAVSKRCKLLSKVANLLLERKERYAKLIAKEMGKPVSQGISEIEKCAWVCDFYAHNAEEFLADEIIGTDADESFISHDPSGIILGVMPWNFPFWQVLRFAAPTLTAGNTVLLKHASNVTGCSLALAELFQDAGFPEHCYQMLIASHDHIESVISHKDIAGVSVTGSETAGRSIAVLAGKNLKKTVLELGGNNACIIWEDADLEKYMQTIINARLQNTGQSCIAAKRFIVHEEIYDRFLTLLKEELPLQLSGNPLNSKTQIGVIARTDLADKLDQQIRDSVNKGAKLTYGNLRKKNYFDPTILENVEPGMPAFDDELFGPVFSITKVKNRNESIRIAADSKFGLGTMLFTEDIKTAKQTISKVPDGCFFINEMVKSHPELPFGGTKTSGYGRELSKEGILAFVNKKTVYIVK